MTTILLTGRTGQLGRELERLLAPLGRIVAPGREVLDLARPDSIRRVVRDARPEVIVNAAGFTAVDQAEHEPDAAMQVNGVAPGILAEEARRCGALLIHYSTTFVFDGTKRGPYVETDLPNPVNVYGRSKLAGEQAIAAAGCSHLILRATWTYGAHRPNFLLTLLRLAREKPDVGVVEDQIASPTSATSYAGAGAKLLESIDGLRDKTGIYHLSAAGQTSRYEFARRIVDFAAEATTQPAGWARIRPILTRDYPLPARRPLNTVMNNEKAERILGLRLKHWEEDLKTFLTAMLARMPGPASVG